MISLEQVLLLQKKVETAVERISSLQNEITQLRSDNDALRSKCAELSNALAAKTELVSSLETNQGKIEEGILNAMSRLDAVTNSTGGSPVPRAPVTFDTQEPIQQEPAAEPQQEEIPFRYEIVPDDEPSEEEEESNTDDNQEANGDQQAAQEQDANSLNGQFDIF